MKQYIITAILALCLVSCNRHSGHWETLMQVESFIEEKPDSALSVLQDIDVDGLSGKEEKAKHALLLSMALDKNVIDKTDFEVLQPAIDYYEDNGSATDKLRTYYYQGRVYQNQGKNALAIESFLNALDKGEESDDILTKARTYFAQGTIYYSLIEWDNFIETNKSAATYFQEAEAYNSYANCLIRIINGYTLKDDPDNAMLYIDECKRMLGVVSMNRLADYYSSYLTYLIKYGSSKEIDTLIDEYNDVVPAAKIDWLTISNAYLELERYDDALYAIGQYKKNPNANQEKKYKVLTSEIYKNLGRYEEALDAYEKYMVVSDSATYAIMRQDTRFVEERHNLELQKAKEADAKNRLIIIVLACVIVVLLLIIAVYLIRKRLKETKMVNARLESEKAHYEQMYNEVLVERNALNEMLANSTIKNEAAEIIRKRLGVLNTIIVSHLSEKGTDIKRANEELERLIADSNDFIKSTRLTLEENYPHFFAFLKEKGLEDFEIDFCCLYAIGLKGKEVKTYTNLSRHYKDSSEVRQKLGLVESDTNLSNFLQRLLKNEHG